MVDLLVAVGGIGLCIGTLAGWLLRASLADTTPEDDARALREHVADTWK